MASHQPGAYTYRWPRPAVTVDAVIVAEQAAPKVLLIQRKNDPFAGEWALPGGFVDENEPLDQAVLRELQEETSIPPDKVGVLAQIGAFGDPGRDPRGWCVTVAYAALVPSTEVGVAAADDAADAAWFDITALPALAFDHNVIISTAFRQLTRHNALEGDSKADLRNILLRAATT
jgi:8-oxo-dGTP diphosphatase